jgi:hypothetical protein
MLLAGGGRGGIRTHGTLAGTPVFKTGALNHSATLPLQRHQSLGGPKIKNGLATWTQFGPKRFRLIYLHRRESNHVNRRSVMSALSSVGAGMLPQRQHFPFADSSALPLRLAEHHLRKVATLRLANRKFLRRVWAFRAAVDRRSSGQNFVGRPDQTFRHPLNLLSQPDVCPFPFRFVVRHQQRIESPSRRKSRKPTKLVLL